ncbi:nucleotidyltransferase domain-containing protein [Rossellomorea vietnamensis]|uniref:Nucleotidyltransferase domain-containing protein n=1 Tax=Rossellomorea vietnamensis TaxID=218284 RepID=A0A5D4ME81_9BACI|nr:nucleotidyltransferase domain-containing protein [Rossellomorea vietnamensis]TYS00240.1 nucleotidyltransferase domain-containing protein [Rossellomorea vietnamensis]
MGFVSKHEQRDQDLPKKREELLQTVLKDLSNDPDVRGIYLGGSLAKGNNDRYSDIDLHIIVSPDSKSDFIRDKYERPRKWGNVLFFEGHPDNPVIVTHFDCFVKVDTFYKEPGELIPSLWLAGLKALYDPEGIVEKVLRDSSQLEYSPSAEEVEAWRGKIFAFIHETYRASMRKERYYASANLDRLRWLIAQGWYMESGQRIDSSYGIWSKLEGERSLLKDWQLALLESWESTRNPADIMKTVSSILPEFFRLNKQLCGQTGIQENEAWCREVISKVI